MSSPLPEFLRDFIAAHISTLDDLEILALLRASTTSWTAKAVARELRLDLESTTHRLGRLHAHGLLTATHESEPGYRYDARDGASAFAVGELIRLYGERRVAVVTAIFSKSSATPVNGGEWASSPKGR